MSLDHVLYEAHTGGVRILKLNRPQALNAITMDMSARLLGLLEQIEADAEARVIILTGVGDRAFSAGFDIREMADFSPSQMRDAFVARDPLMLAFVTHRLPVIAALNGLAHGAGALLAAACDFRVAGPTASFKVTAIGYGSANATWSLPRLIGAARAKDILMTGREVSLEEGSMIGLFDRVHESDALEGALALTELITRHPPYGVSTVKRLVDASASLSLRDAWQAEHDAMLESFDSQGAGGSEVFEKFLSKK